MAIRFTPSYNAEIRRVVNSFNKKRTRAIKKGYRDLPPPLTVADLKARYDNRSDLDRDLKLIQKFNSDEALLEVENSGGAKAIAWEVMYLKNNIKKAKEFYDRELYEARNEKVEGLVTKNEYVNNIKAKRDILDLELAQLNQSDYRTYRATINEYLRASSRTAAGYRGWLKEVETIMRNMGYDNKTINKFFEGFEKLTPRQFLKLYRNNSLVSRIYELYIPTVDHSFKLSAPEEEAKDLIDTFMEEKDQMIKDVQREEKELDENYFIEDVSKQIEKMNDKHFREMEEDLSFDDWQLVQSKEYKKDPKKLKEFEEWMKMTE